MAIINELKGLVQVVKNLNAAQRQMGENFARGIKKAGLALQKESQRLVPVDTGNLKASAFTRASGQGVKTIVTVGYTANYALYVHEAVGMVLKGQPRPKGRGKYWDPQGRAQAKFLEEPYRRMGPQLLDIVKQSMKL